MARSKTSSKWLTEHFSDIYVQKAQQLGYRSRAAFKLLEIQEKDKIIQSGMFVVDLGSAPGGWSQVARQFIGKNGKIVALDILEMDSLAQVEFIQGDFTKQQTLDKLIVSLDNQAPDLVISDMAPNISGVKVVDNAKALYLVELAVELADDVLKPGGNLLLKVFQGQGFDTFYKQLRLKYKKIITRKPDSSRARSAEIYLLAKGLIK
ncbi:MAG: 23S rRNA (uridine(2552)-2'-O)-methyltransferase RlmE [Pseudomonadota bacterium]